MARFLESPSVRIKWLAGPRSVSLGAGWCLLGLLFMGAMIHLATVFLGEAGLIIALPLAFLALLILFMAFFCAVSGLVLWLVSMLAPRQLGSLSIRDGLRVESGTQLALFQLITITRARLNPAKGILALRTRDGDVIEAGVSSLNAAYRALDAIAGGMVHGTWSASLCHGVNERWWRSSPPLAGVALTALGTALSCAFLSPNAALSLGLALGICGMTLGSLRKAAAAQDCVIVGSDGLSIRQSNKERFIAFTRVTTACETAFGLSLLLKGGEAVELTLIPSGGSRRAAIDLDLELAEKRRAHLLERIQAEIAPRDPDALRAAALLERKGRSVRDWRAALAALTSEAGDYRRAMLTKEQAQQVLDDGKAPPELRLGAALALSPTADEGTLVKLRVAVETCVNPAMRLALTRASYGELDDQTLASALEEAEAEAEADVEGRARV